jgi:acyl dehydratase
MPFDIAKVGATRDSEEFRVNSYRLAQFAAALGDENPRHLAGEAAPPVFAHIPVMQSMIELLRGTADGFLLHGEQDFHFHRPIVPGMRLKTLSRLQGLLNSKAGVQLVVRSETRDQEGLVCVQFATCLVQGAKLERDLGEPAPAKPSEPDNASATEVTVALPDDQAARYAEAARDYSAYTLDQAAAEKAGFPAPILHGMCTLSLAARAVVDRSCGGDVSRLKRLGARFAHPLFLTGGQRLTTRLRQAGSNVAFECSDATGNVVLKRGVAEVAP